MAFVGGLAMGPVNFIILECVHKKRYLPHEHKCRVWRSGINV